MVLQNIPTDHHDSIASLVVQDLKKELEEVQRYRSLILGSKSNLRENLHDLRIRCRKGIVALDFYKSFLAKRGFQRLRSKLKRLLRSSSTARDLDVLLQSMEQMQSKAAEPFLRRLRKDRKRQVQSFQKAASELDLAHGWKKLRNRIPESPLLAISITDSQSYRNWAQQRTKSVVEKRLGDARDAAAIESWTPKKLHRLRIRIKRLRYSLDLASSLGPDVAALIDGPLITQIQRILGDINDIAVRLRYLREYSSRMKEPDCREFLLQQIANDERELAVRIDHWNRLWTEDLQSKF
ncbi:CHAD domain-containing protein [Pirellulaceae bacterium SH501]